MPSRQPDPRNHVFIIIGQRQVYIWSEIECYTPRSDQVVGVDGMSKFQ